MTLITICSAKHSPGVTTLGQALALQTGAFFIEADPAGGDLAARWGVPTDPGMLTLAAASRRGVSRDLIDRHGQSPAGYPVLVAPPSAEQSRSAILTLGRPFAEHLASGTDITPSTDHIGAVADCGRWDPASPCVDLVAESSVTLVVLRPTVESVAQVRTRLASIAVIARHVLVITIGSRPYGSDEVATALGDVTTFGLASDERSASFVRSGRSLDRSLRRAPLIRSVADLIAELHAVTSVESPRALSPR